MKHAPALTLILLAACSPDAPPPAAAPPPSRPPASATPLTLIFKVPDGWTRETPAGSLRRAQYRVPDKEKAGKDAELAVFEFQPSSIEENIARWAGQMGAPPPKGEEIQGNFKITLADITGSYAGDAGGDPIQNARMLAGIVEVEDKQWYFKLVGPAATVGDWREEFIALLKDARK